MSDISCLNAFNGLKKLYIKGNPVSDYSVLSGIYADLELKDFRLENVDDSRSYTGSVPSDKVWTVEFNMDIDPDSVNAGRVTVSNGNYDIVSGCTLEISDDGKKLLVNPPSQGYASENYTLFIEKGVRSALGQTIGKNVEMKFEVE